MSLEQVGEMVGIAALVSSASIFVVGLMIRASITEATAKLAGEIHGVLEGRYVSKEVHERDLLLVKAGIAECRSGIEYLEDEMRKQ